MAGDDPGTQTPDMAALLSTLERLQQEWLRSAGEVAAQLSRALGGDGGAGPADLLGESAAEEANRAPAAASELLRVAAPLMRAQALWLEGGLRYMGRLSEANGSYLGELYQRLADTPPDGLDARERRELNDQTRAYLRRVAELSLQEARVLEQRLAEVEAEVREPAAPQPAPTRLAKAKD